MSATVETRSEDSTCRRCGAAVTPDDEGEHRQRVVLEDLAHSSGSRLETKLCSGCWWEIFDGLVGGGQ